jgi:cytochrome c
MEFNKIAGAILLTLVVAMVISKIGNTLVPEYHPPKDKAGAETVVPQQPTEPEAPFAELIAAADPAEGKTRAQQQCASCHTFDKGGANRVGPNLWDVVGRKHASVAGFAYSNGMKATADKEWGLEDIYKFVANPGAVVPGTSMAYRQPNAKQRAAIVAFLRSLSDNPKPLPPK